MAKKPNRREFLKSSMAAMGAGAVLGTGAAKAAVEGPSKMVSVSSANGIPAVTNFKLVPGTFLSTRSGFFPLHKISERPSSTE